MKNLTLFISISSLAAPLVARDSNKPNLLFIFPDQFRIQAMGFMGEDPVQTPNLDQLASQSVNCFNTVSTMPLSSPFRGMLMTGKYPHQNNISTNCNTYANQFGTYLREDEICFSDVLKASGYYCGYIGKWHLDAPEGEIAKGWQNAIWDTYTPPGKMRHGFDYWSAYGCHNEHNNPYYWVNEAAVTDTIFPGLWSPEFEANQAIDFIYAKGDADARDSKEPWALFVSMNPPHGPYNEVPQKYKDIYSQASIDSLLNRPNVPKGKSGNKGRNSVRDYFACVTGVDHEIGRILDALEQSGEVENTIVVFTADHGEMMGSHGYMQKVVHYDESFRIPFLVRWPSKLIARKDPIPMGVPDFMPTFLGMMGLSGNIPKGVTGNDFSDVILGKSDKRPEFALYMRPGENIDISNARGLRGERYTFLMTRSQTGYKYMLFDNLNDPYQMNNIASQHPPQVADYRVKLLKRLKEIQDPWVTDDFKF